MQAWFFLKNVVRRMGRRRSTAAGHDAASVFRAFGAALEGRLALRGKAAPKVRLAKAEHAP